MRNIILSIVLCCSVFVAFAQKGTTTVNGIIRFKSNKGVSVDLYKVQSGDIVRIDSTKEFQEGVDSVFTFKFKPLYKGYYVVGVRIKGVNMFDAFALKYRFYAKGNDAVNMVITNTSYQLTGKNTKENQLLYDWETQLRTIKGSALVGKSYTDVYEKITEFDKQSKTWLNGKSSGNQQFDNLLASTIPNDIAYCATRYVVSPRSSTSPWEQKLEDYKGYILNTDFKKLMADSFMVKLPLGAAELNTLISVMNRINYFKGDSVRLKEPERIQRNLGYIPDNTLKGIFLLNECKSAYTYENLNNIITTYPQYLDKPYQQEIIAAKMEKLSEFKKGTPAVDFTFPDVNGKNVSLSDFKGKIVVIDVWATWCAPCKKELPSLKELEEQFHDNDNIVFMGVSIDKLNDVEKWKKFVADNDLKGIQLISGPSGTVIQDAYKISGIPRFMVFDKQGRVIDINSPRPSDPALKDLLLKALEGK